MSYFAYRCSAIKTSIQLFWSWKYHHVTFDPVSLCIVSVIVIHLTQGFDGDIEDSTEIATLSGCCISLERKVKGKIEKINPTRWCNMMMKHYYGILLLSKFIINTIIYVLELNWSTFLRTMWSFSYLWKILLSSNIWEKLASHICPKMSYSSSKVKGDSSISPFPWLCLQANNLKVIHILLTRTSPMFLAQHCYLIGSFCHQVLVLFTWSVLTWDCDNRLSYNKKWLQHIRTTYNTAVTTTKSYKRPSIHLLCDCTCHTTHDSLTVYSILIWNYGSKMSITSFFSFISHTQHGNWDLCAPCCVMTQFFNLTATLMIG